MSPVSASLSLSKATVMNNNILTTRGNVNEETL